MEMNNADSYSSGICHGTNLFEKICTGQKNTVETGYNVMKGTEYFVSL
jgi:hypothetical protein